MKVAVINVEKLATILEQADIEEAIDTGAAITTLGDHPYLGRFASFNPASGDSTIALSGEEYLNRLKLFSA